MATSATSKAADVRKRLSHAIAGVLNRGAAHVRVRVHLTDGQPARAVLLSHRDNTWHEGTADLVESDQLEALKTDLAMLASLGHAGDVTVRQVSSHEFLDTDIQFRSDWVAAHRGERLDAYVEGSLFFEAQGSGKDKRRNIRTPHRGA